MTGTRITAAALAILLGTGCSAAHRAQREAFARDDRGEYLARSIREAEGAPPAVAAMPEEWTKAAAALCAKSEAWKGREKAAEIYRGFRPLSGDAAEKRSAELADDAVRERELGAAVDLSDVSLLSAARGPSIRAARAKWRAALERYEQAGYLENILLQYRAFTKSLDLKIGEDLQRGAVEEAFPFPASLTLKGELVDREAGMAWEELRKEIRVALVAARDAHHELEYLAHALAVTGESRRLLADMETVARTRYQAGATGQVDVLRVQSELSRLDYELSRFGQEKAAAEARLNVLLDRPAHAPFGDVRPAEVADPQPELDAMLSAALERRQELRFERLKVEETELAIRLGETTTYPRASLGSSLAQTGQGPEAGPDRAESIFPVRPEAMPRFWFGSQSAYLDEARRGLEQERATLAALENDVRRETRDLHVALDTVRKQVALFESALVPQSEQALAAARAGYETGKSGFIDFLESQRTALEARLGLEMARRDLKAALNRLTDVLGADTD